MFEGKLSDFRGAGNILKTEEEKRSMAEKHRFKQNREFKKRINEEEENEEGDIRTFKFHRIDFKDRGDNSRERRRAGRERHEFTDRSERRGDRRGRDSKGGRDRRDFNKKGRRYDD